MKLLWAYENLGFRNQKVNVQIILMSRVDISCVCQPITHVSVLK